MAVLTDLPCVAVIFVSQRTSECAAEVCGSSLPNESDRLSWR